MRILIALALALFLGACGNKKAEEPAKKAEAPKVAAPAKPAEPAAAAGDEKVPVADDFAEEADKEITEDNVDGQLDALEKDIDSPAE